ncbi:MAG TPA: MurT ligase domain-containing protein [Actinomycetes bacterium]|nr:MurT ligase domain-containing protein [Actinomycetes bacterium]
MDHRPPLPVATRMALLAGRGASRLSRRLGQGRGAQVGGKVAYRLRPKSLRDLAAGRTTALVSATNGKSTTATLLQSAVRTLAPTAFNAMGANMEEGIVAALDAERSAPLAVLETDEAYLGVVVAATRPQVLVLMNLSRDFLERGVRAKALSAHWRQTVAAIDWPCTVVANADDPLVAGAVMGSADVVWVAGEDTFIADGLLCRDCRIALDRSSPPHWRCPRCDFARPTPHWSLHGSHAVGPGGEVALPAALPGRAASVNALFALAGAQAMGVDPLGAVQQFARVENVDGRYARHNVGGHSVRVLLAKNPASWSASIATVKHADGEQRASVVFAMAGRGTGGGQDTAMLWDAPFEELAGVRVTTAGSRGDELAVRLIAAGLEVEPAGEDVFDVVKRQPPGPVDLVANWPAFNQVLDRIGRG